MKIIGIIPARFASTRFPGKPLANIDGKSMIQLVFEQATKSKLLAKTIVATDDKRIFDHVIEFGGEVLMTSHDHPNGTTRCNEVILKLKELGEEFDAVVNIQGDEPKIHPEQIDNVARLFEHSETQIGTLAKLITTSNELFDANVVKVVMAENKQALFFSRQAIPLTRGFDKDLWLENTEYYKHIGIYGYKTEILSQIANLPVGKLEEAECLEQLRWLENGISISINKTDFESISIDTPEDLLKLETIT